MSHAMSRQRVLQPRQHVTAGQPTVPYPAQQVTVPAGHSGAWRVERFVVDAVTAERFARTRYVQLIGGVPRWEWQKPAIPPGEYTRLVRRDGDSDVVVMADTAPETRGPSGHGAFIEAAHCLGGHVLIGGLGLGAVLQDVLASPQVTHATVLEQSADVLALVGPHSLARYGPDRLTLVQADVLRYVPARDERYSAVWLDVWDDLSPLYLPQFRLLRARWQPHTAWLGQWGEPEAEALWHLGWRGGPGDLAVMVEG